MHTRVIYMGIIGDSLRWLAIGGQKYPPSVEAVLTGEMQGHYSYARPNAKTSYRRSINAQNGAMGFHPNYVFGTIAATEHAIRGAFALHLIGLDGKQMSELEDIELSKELVPNLEFLGGAPVNYEWLGLMGAVNFLKITKMVTIQNGHASPLTTATAVLKANPKQVYTVYPHEHHQHKDVDIDDDGYTTPLMGMEDARRVLQQYDPHYKRVYEV